jgi:parallel beta-helix repeat protein
MPRVKKLASLTFVTVLVITLIVGVAPIVLADHNGDKGSFDVLVFENGNWQLKGELSFSDYETLELPLDNDAGQVSIKLVQHGHDGAYVDYIALHKDFVTYLPSGAINADSNTNILNKIISPEYDVCDAWDSALEIVWDNVPVNTTLVMRAMEEDLGIGHGGPLYYPNIHRGETLGYTLVNDGGIAIDGVMEETTEPDFSVFWRPDSPHPDGYTYGWLHCDRDYLYAAVEVTADNTPDEEDWGALYVMVDGDLKEFRISCDDNQWGTNGFQYTPSVVYEHRIYEFQIPLSEINARIGDEINYGFGCYGTVFLYYEVWVDDDWVGLTYGDPADGHTFGMDAFAVIQDGIDAVHEDGMVHVAAGTYNETVDINKSLTLQGEGRDVVTVDANWADQVFNVTADYVTISGFTIERAYWEGVRLNYADYCEISHNIIRDNADGIYLYYSYHNTITDNFIYSNTWSCPFVYSWDGQEYRLDSMMLNVAATKAREGTDYDNLDYLTPADGKYLLKVTEELFETSYVDELKLMVVDHPVGTQIIPDLQGNMHTLRAPYAPIAGEGEDGTDCLAKVTEPDGIYWTSNLDNKDFSKEGDLRDSIILTFEKPENAGIAKVAVNFQDNKLAEYVTANVVRLPGGSLQQKHPLVAFLRRLHLQVWNGTEWVSEGDFISPGSFVARDMIKLIDVSAIEGTTIKIKLESLTGVVLVDSVRMDYSADEAVIASELSAITAVDASGTDVAPQILDNDDDYLVMEQGDYVYLSFDELVASPGYDRSYVVKADGYYQSPLMAPAEGEVYEELSEKLLSDHLYAARYFLEYALRSGHCGILLNRSDDNEISGNEVYDNDPADGIYLYYSNSNSITDNDVHDNGHGIYLSVSNDTKILRNNILDNKELDSGIHLESGCSGNVIHCNNIVGNLPYGVSYGNGMTVVEPPSLGLYNQDSDEPVDATYNWWGCIEGPGASGCDLVSGNVIYDPWLLDEFQYCRECREAPTPPGVPTVNHWGIVAMIALFAGLLVWRVRRRRLAL